MNIGIEVTDIAKVFLAKQDLKGFTCSLLGTCPDRVEKGKWNVFFQVTSPAGKLIEGPAIVVVDEMTRTAEFFLSL